MKKEIFNKNYDGENIYDVTRDISEALPKDEYGFIKGEFKVTVEWTQSESSTFTSDDLVDDDIPF